MIAEAIYGLHELRTIIINASKTLHEIQQAIKTLVATVRVDVEDALVGAIQGLLIEEHWDAANLPATLDRTNIYGGVLLLDQVF